MPCVWLECVPTLSSILVCFSVDQILYSVSVKQPRGIMVKSFQGFAGAVRLLRGDPTLLIVCGRVRISPFLFSSALGQGAVRPTFLYIHTSFLLWAHRSRLFERPAQSSSLTSLSEKKKKVGMTSALSSSTDWRLAGRLSQWTEVC